MDVSVEVHCGKCGSANYSLSEGLEPSSTVLCNDCGTALASVAELKEELASQLLSHSAEVLRRGLPSAANDDSGPALTR